MIASLMPNNIYEHLAARVLGQEAALRAISVAIYKHINHIGGARILMIGNSGTGKTTIMQAIEEFYAAHESLAEFRAMTIMNARTLLDEAGDVDTFAVFRSLENRVAAMLGEKRAPRDVQVLMENATVCLDEIDKISGKIAGKSDVTGMRLQQALLTFIEGERFLYRARVHAQGAERYAKLPINTRNILFVCGGAFEELYDQVYARVDNKEDERRLKEVRVYDKTSGMKSTILFTLRDYLKMSDLFYYGMAPQFLSRFGSIAMLDDLGRETLQRILLHSKDSPFNQSRTYFKTMDIDLRITDEAVDLVVSQAADNTRLGARALREVFSRVIMDLEFDPFDSGALRDGENGTRVLEIDAGMVDAALQSWEE
ncbi:AAA family ATPase [Oceanidesulfovibrio marinus]|nr:AAA family ATPase [Oceanidesulfovibrio marinus]